MKALLAAGLLAGTVHFALHVGAGAGIESKRERLS